MGILKPRVHFRAIHNPWETENNFITRNGPRLDRNAVKKANFFLP